MARATSGAGEWWTFFGGWTRIGLIAAGIAAIIAGTAAIRSRQVEERIAYQAVIEAAPTVPGMVATSVPSTTARQATLRYVFSY